MKSEIEFLDRSPNRTVVRLPGRRFAGVVVEGDTLFDLYSEAQEIVEMLNISDSDEAKHIAKTIVSRLGGLLDHYEGISVAAGLELAYTKTDPQK